VSGVRRIGPLVGLVVAVVALSGVGTSGAAAAGRFPCVVRNTSTHASYNSLGTAIAAASTWNALSIGGVCIGNWTVGKNLTLIAAGPVAVLESGGEGSVLTVNEEARVAVRGLTITGGDYVSGGGVDNVNGDLTIANSIVTDNSAVYGGGIYNDANLNLVGTTVSNNEANAGGGIFNDLYGTATLSSNSSVDDNSSSVNGGGIDNLGGSVTLGQGSEVSDNSAGGGGGAPPFGCAIHADGCGDGGGIYMYGGTVTLNKTSRVDSNDAGYGGGIYDIDASVTLNDSSTISYNSADFGGGVYLFYGVVTLNQSSSISYNDASYGGGVVSVGGTVVNPSRVFDNIPTDIVG